MAIRFVQQSTVVNSAGGTPNPTLGINSTPGNVVIAVVYTGGIRTASVSGMGATWVPLGDSGSLSGSTRVFMFAGIVVTPGTSLTIASSSAQASAQLIEFSGIDAGLITNGVNSHADASGSTSIQPGNITTTNANDLVISAAGVGPIAGATGTITQSGAPWNALNGANPSTTIFGTAALYQIVSTPGSFNPSFSWTTATGDGALIVALQAAPSISPTPPPPAIQSIIANFSQPLWRIQGFKFGRTSSPLIAIPGGVTPPPPQIQQIWQNFSLPLWRPQGFAYGFNSSVVAPAFPTPPAPNIPAVLRNFSGRVFPQGYAAGWSSSVTLAFPTPPAPNIPAIIRNFAPLPVQPQGYVVGWNSSVPLAFPTPPAPSVPAILRNFSTLVLPFTSRYGTESSAAIIVPPTTISVVPIARVLANNSPWFALQGARSAHDSSTPIIIPPPPSITPPPPIRQIIINNSPYLVLPVFGAGILGAIVPPPVPGGLHAAFTLILADSFKTYLLAAASEAGMAILADDMVITLKSCAAAQRISLQVAESAQRITLESSI